MPKKPIYTQLNLSDWDRGFDSDFSKPNLRIKLWVKAGDAGMNKNKKYWFTADIFYPDIDLDNIKTDTMSDAVCKVGGALDKARGYTGTCVCWDWAVTDITKLITNN